MKNVLFTGALLLVLAACGDKSKTDMTAHADDGNIDYAREDKGLITLHTRYGEVRGYNQFASFYGVWQEDSGQIHKPIYRGSEAVYNVPTSGQATYLGNAVRYDDLTGKVLTDGTSRINIDFAEKKVDGEIKMPGLRRDIKLHEGDLRGTYYAGEASVIGNDNGRYYGELFGEDARETAGVVEFDKDRNLSTAFGGVRHD